jgi:hypothetical protein
MFMVGVDLGAMFILSLEMNLMVQLCFIILMMPQMSCIVRMIGVPQINQTTFAGASSGFLQHLPVINKRSYLISNMLLNQISGADVIAHCVEGHQTCLYFVSTCDRRPPDAEA